MDTELDLVIASDSGTGSWSDSNLGTAGCGGSSIVVRSVRRSVSGLGAGTELGSACGMSEDPF